MKFREWIRSFKILGVKEDKQKNTVKALIEMNLYSSIGDEVNKYGLGDYEVRHAVERYLDREIHRRVTETLEKTKIPELVEEFTKNATLHGITDQILKERAANLLGGLRADGSKDVNQPVIVSSRRY